MRFTVFLQLLYAEMCIQEYLVLQVPKFRNPPMFARSPVSWDCDYGPFKSHHKPHSKLISKIQPNNQDVVESSYEMLISGTPNPPAHGGF